MHDEQHTTAATTPTSSTLDYASPTSSHRARAGPSPLAPAMWLTGNVWLLVALVLFISASKQASSPPWYAIFGSWWFPAVQYWLILGIVTAAGVAMLVFAVHGSRRG